MASILLFQKIKKCALTFQKINSHFFFTYIPFPQSIYKGHIYKHNKLNFTILISDEYVYFIHSSFGSSRMEVYFYRGEKTFFSHNNIYNLSVISGSALAYIVSFRNAVLPVISLVEKPVHLIKNIFLISPFAHKICFP